MRRMLLFNVVLGLCLSAYAQQGVPPGYSDASSTAVNTNNTKTQVYAGTGFNNINNTPVTNVNNNPTNTNLAGAAANGGAGGNATNSGSYENALQNVNILNFPEAEKQRTPIPGLPLGYPGFPRADAQGPQIFGPIPNGGIEVFRWGKDSKGNLENGDYYIQNARRVLSGGGLVGIAENIGMLLFEGKTGYQAKGFNLSNFTRTVGKRSSEGGKLLPLIIINSARHNLANEALYAAGYVWMGTLPIDPPVRYKGAVVDDSVVKGVYLDLLKGTNVAIAQFYYQSYGQPVSETQTSYLGLGAATNERHLGLTVGGSKVNAESATSTRWPSLMKCWVYDPKQAAKHLATPDAIMEKLKNAAERGSPVSPGQLLQAVDEKTIYYLDQQKASATTGLPPSAISAVQANSAGKGEVRYPPSAKTSAASSPSPQEVLASTPTVK